MNVFHFSNYFYVLGLILLFSGCNRQPEKQNQRGGVGKNRDTLDPISLVKAGVEVGELNKLFGPPYLSHPVNDPVLLLFTFVDFPERSSEAIGVRVWVTNGVVQSYAPIYGSSPPPRRLARSVVEDFKLILKADNSDLVLSPITFAPSEIHGGETPYFKNLHIGLDPSDAARYKLFASTNAGKRVKVVVIDQFLTDYILEDLDSAGHFKVALPGEGMPLSVFMKRWKVDNTE